MNTSNSIPPAVCLAFDCIARSREDTPRTGGSYYFERSNYSDQINKEPEERIVYHDLNGEKCTQVVAARILGLSDSGARYLFKKHKCDYEYIYANYGTSMDNIAYKDINGSSSNPSQIANYYKTTRQAVRRCFKVAGFDYKKAHSHLLKTFGSRVVNS